MKMPDGWVVKVEEKGGEVSFKSTRELVTCKNCKYYLEDVWSVVNGLPIITAHEVCDFWSNGCKTDPDGYCFCGEKKDG